MKIGHRTVLSTIFVVVVAAVYSVGQNLPVVPNNSPRGASNLTTAGAVPYVSASGTLNQDPTNLFWDSTNKRLGIGTGSPGAQLQITDSGVAQNGWVANSVGSASAPQFRLNAANAPGIFFPSSLLAFTAGGASAVESHRVMTTGNVLFGGTTEGNYRVDVQKSGSTGTFRVYDQTATTGATRVLFDLGAADTSSTEIFRINGAMRFGGSNSTGAGSALLGANSPATTLTAPYTWIKIVTSDGSTAYIPAWK